MASPEMLNSARFSGRSNFSQTCSLLSRYLKEKGSFGDICLSLNHDSELRDAPMQTMDLLPTLEKSKADPLPLQFDAEKKSDLCDAKSAAEAPAPMTIFYGGSVIVFNDLPPNKASEIISMAHKSSTAVAEPASVVPNKAALPSAQPLADSDLPIARKNSLSRFLEKRKDRITTSAPYPVNNKRAPPLKSAVKAEPWLGLSSPHLPLQFH